MSNASNQAIVKAVAGVLGEHLRAIASALKSQSERIEVLEGRQLFYRGVWRDDAAYSKGNMTTHAGGIWHCERACKGDLPGRSDAWKLAVKGGG